MNKSKKLKYYEFIKRLQALPYVNEIWLFGSRARADNRDRSDIDLAILCPEANNMDWLKILDIIEGADTLLKIDCVRFDKLSLSSELRQNILREKQVIYAQNNY